MPKLWHHTIEAHRRAVSDATLDAAARLVTERGLSAVTMSDIADTAGIGRATLYKYYPSIEAVLRAWHERQIKNHLSHLVAVRNAASGSLNKLEAVLEAFAAISHERHEGGIAALLHRGRHVAKAERQLAVFIRDLIIHGVEAGELRDDVAPDELASYCVHALTAAGSLSSKPAVRRLVSVTLAGLRPSR